MNNPRIALFDSGIGGLSLVAAIRKRFSYLDIYYANDNANFPYGPKSEDEVTRILLAYVKRVYKEVRFDAVVIGCNTASTVALPVIRANLTEPVIGVVPAIKPAASMTKTGHIGLLATEGTVNRQYTKDLIATFASDCTVHMIGSNELVYMAEGKIRGKQVDVQKVRTIVRPFLTHAVDVVVLGCTHFPFLTDIIDEALGGDCRLVDSGGAIANRIGQVLALEETVSNKDGDLHAFFSKESEDLHSLRSYLKRTGFVDTKVLA